MGNRKNLPQHGKPKPTLSLTLYEFTEKRIARPFLCLAVRTGTKILYVSGHGIIPVILIVACYLGIAWWLIGGAKLLMKRAYPDTDSAPKTTERSLRPE
jgi:hypothetical protein